MPGSIQKFFWIACANLLAGIAITAAVDLRLLGDTLSLKQVCFTATFQGGYYIIVFALVWLAANRAMNWARWLYATLALYTLQGNTWPLVDVSAMSSLGLLTLAQGILKIVSICLLFTTASGIWFKLKRSKAEA